MKTTKKKLALLLALVLTLAVAAPALLPGIAAAEVKYTQFEEGKFSYGFNQEKGLLIIKGEGMLPQFNEENPAPWEDVKESITRVIVCEGITGIRAGAFSGCKNLVSVVLPESVELIFPSAFKNCEALESIETTNVEKLATVFPVSILKKMSSLSLDMIEAEALNEEITAAEKKPFDIIAYLRATLPGHEIDDSLVRSSRETVKSSEQAASGR